MQGKNAKLNYDNGNEGQVQSDDLHDDSDILRWHAPEYLVYKKGVMWYVATLLIFTVLMATAVYFRAYTFMILMPVMLIAMYVYTHRSVDMHNYTLTKKGLYIDDHFYAYDEFRRFTLMIYDKENKIFMIPSKRLGVGVSFYFPEEIGEVLVDVLAARLPMEQKKPDFIDRLLKQIHL